MQLSKENRRARIKMRIRKISFGNESKPRLSVYRSNKEIYAQLVDDLGGKTLMSATSLNNKEAKGKSKTETRLSTNKNK